MSTTTKIILFNGPPGSGKDFGALHFQNSANACVIEIKDKLISLACNIFDLTREQWASMYSREQKELPQEVLDGRSPRDVLKHLSETVIKPNYGQDYFIRSCIKRLQPGINAISDGGFDVELEALTQAVGAKNLLVVKLFSEGCNFSNDSRNYFSESLIESLGVRREVVINTKDASFNRTLDAVARQFLKPQGEGRAVESLEVSSA